MKVQGDLLVIGAGLAGLVAGWRAAARGEKVRVIAKGWGATHWLPGCIDVLGYYPLDSQTPVKSPAQAVPQLIRAQPQHPYALLGMERLQEALTALQELCAAANYPLVGTLQKNWLLPTAVGTQRPTCLAPATMTAGDLSDKSPILVVGFEQLRDFYPRVIADNLQLQGIPARSVVLDLASLGSRRFTNPTILAPMLEDTVFRSELVAKLGPHLEGAARVAFPAVLGMRQAATVVEALQNRLRRPVFEIPGLTPSVPGIRLHHILVSAIRAGGGSVLDGMEALTSETEAGRVKSVQTESSTRPRSHRFQRYLLATGGILGGGIDTDRLGEVREVVFDLPVTKPDGRLQWFRQEFLAKEGHPIYQAGVNVDQRFQPLNGDRRPIYDNLYAAGTTLAHCEVIRERSFEGVAVATGYAAAGYEHD